MVQVAARLVSRGLAYPNVRRLPIGDESEAHFQNRVRRLARLYGWRDWHQRDSTGTRAGLPDLLLVRPPRVVFAELKSQHGKLRLEQIHTLGLLGQCPGLEAWVWRPSDWQQIVEVLR